MEAIPSVPQRQGLHFYKAFFEIVDAVGVRRSLLDSGGLELLGGCAGDGDRWYRWDLLVQSPEAPSMSFLVRTKRDRLVLEGPSAEAVGRGWRELDRVLKPFARARVAAADNLGRFLPRQRKYSADRPESWSREHEAQVLREFYSALCRRWVDQPNPRLDGMTPGAAAADPTMCDRLDLLLERMERIEEQRRARGAPGISIGHLRAALKQRSSTA